MLDAYKHAYCDLFDRRKKAYESAIGEIKNRTEWATAGSQRTQSMAASLLVAAAGTGRHR